jgi:hypothetical protein
MVAYKQPPCRCLRAHTQQKFIASKGNCSCCNPLQTNLRLKAASINPSILPASSRPNPGNCEPPPAWPACGQSQGKRQEAYELLRPVYGWFSEGFDTADLKEAKTLLEELG